MQNLNNYSYYKPSFKAGLTKQIKQDINNCDIYKISNKLEHLGIKNDFKDNKTIAWCSLQCIKLIAKINKTYHTSLTLPKGIFVEDFNKLNINRKDALGFINFLPTTLYNNKKDITSEKTIFFNEFKEMNYKNGNKIWNNIDGVADTNFYTMTSTTDFFLEVFLHEFTHIMHEGNMMTKINDNLKFIKTILNMQKDKNSSFSFLQREISQKNCQYATTNQLEMIACDLTKRILSCISKETLQPTHNFLKNSPYTKNFTLKKLFTNESKLDILLRDTWNGK